MLVTFPQIDIAHSYGIKFVAQKLKHFTLVQKPEDNIFDFINKQTKPNDCIPTNTTGQSTKPIITHGENHALDL